VVRPVAFLLATSAAAWLTIISVRDEIDLGKQIQRQVRTQVPRFTDPATVKYVQTIGNRLAAHAGGPGYPYTFSIANRTEINAFALPGGPVWIHRGAIASAGTEAQLAGVLAHEIAHIAKRHAARQIGNTLVANGLLGLLGAVLGNGASARTAQLGAQVLAGGYMLSFSRDDEREADSAGAQIMRRAGWDAREMSTFMDTLRRAQGRDPGSVEVFLSSHPATGERAEWLRRELRNVSGGRRDSPEFRAIHDRLRQIK
jgi:predicted Zn-dependent protease